MSRIARYTEEEFAKLRESAHVVAVTLAEVAKEITPGVPLSYLDNVAEQCIRDHHAIPACKGYMGYPATLCLSVNDVVVHGIPTPNQYLRDGDIVSVDCVALLNGYHGDFCYTFGVGEVDEETKLLLKRTKESLYKAIEVAKAGNTFAQVASAIEQYIAQFNYSVPAEFTGHGIGREMHEEPSIPNYAVRRFDSLNRTKIEKGMSFCVEPMVKIGLGNARDRNVFISKIDRDGWTSHTPDRKPAAHFEHQLIVTDKGTEVISSYKLLGEVIGTEELY
jgi:methionyl aminopeptidase